MMITTAIQGVNGRGEARLPPVFNLVQMVQSRTALNTFQINKIFPSATVLKDFDFIINENNLNVVYQQYFPKEEAVQIFEGLEREIEYFPSEMAMVVYNKR
ncbi:hypothetical protein AVEN_218697-1 [Araneus ventricosus]|uniref:Uncharacterized protein n=1 Tax=Araneus ventricosus TaxID=182803 RepID=A0A4Y2B3P2_ARAVE|nr:hypothetical protein AVEN_218697-1 [Araneus ventricosus]